MAKCFCRDIIQTEDWKPLAIGALVGIAVPGALWFASTRGVALDGQKLIFVGLLLYGVGAVLLLLKKESWSPRRRWYVELGGACLAGPLFVPMFLVVFYLALYGLLPDSNEVRKPQS